MAAPTPDGADLGAVFAAADSEAERHIARLSDWIRQPSNTADPAELSAFAEYLTDDLARTGWSARYIQTGLGIAPSRVLNQIRQHLDASGQGDVSLELLSSVETARSDPSSEIGDAVVATARELYGGAVVKPTEEYAGLQGAWLGQELGIPGVQTGVGSPMFNGHSPNEFMTENALITGIKYAAGIMARFAAAHAARRERTAESKAAGA